MNKAASAKRVAKNEYTFCFTNESFITRNAPPQTAVVANKPRYRKILILTSCLAFSLGGQLHFHALARLLEFLGLAVR